MEAWLCQERYRQCSDVDNVIFQAKSRLIWNLGLPLSGMCIAKSSGRRSTTPSLEVRYDLVEIGTDMCRWKLKQASTWRNFAATITIYRYRMLLCHSAPS